MQGPAGVDSHKARMDIAQQRISRLPGCWRVFYVLCSPSYEGLSWAGLHNRAHSSSLCTKVSAEMVGRG